GGKFDRPSRLAGGYFKSSISWINRAFSGRGAPGSSSAHSTRPCAIASTGNGSFERAKSAVLSRRTLCSRVTGFMKRKKRGSEEKSDGSKCWRSCAAILHRQLLAITSF